MHIETIKDDEYFLCKDFAEKCVRTNFEEYKRRNQFNKDKIISDILTGKLAEIGVYNLLIKKGFEPEKPDFKIYSKENKTFNADIIAKNYDIHIKSQDKFQSDKYGESWMFQKSDKLVSDPTNRDVVVFCIIHYREVIIKKIIKATKLIEKYSEPLKEDLKGNKLTIYYDKIK